MSRTPEDTPLELSESAETDISALLDGELEPERLLEAIDALVDSEACRVFYRRARALDGLIAAAEPTPAEEPPRDVWGRIAERSGLPGESAAWGGRSGQRSRWVGPLIGTLAATVLIAIVAFGVRDDQRSAPVPRPEPVVEGSDLDAITIGGNSGSMTDERFLALAEELLGAERHYRREMAEIILAVESTLPSEMGTPEAQRVGDGVESSYASPELDSIEGGPRSSNLDVRIF